MEKSLLCKAFLTNYICTPIFLSEISYLRHRKLRKIKKLGAAII